MSILRLNKLTECERCDYQTWRYLLCRFAAGGGFGTGGSAPTVICAAITSRMNKAKPPTHVELPTRRCAMIKDSVILLEQLRTIDKQRLKEKICHIDEELQQKVDEALMISLELRT